MSIQMASAIVQRFGPCRIALDREGLADLARELALMGCDPVAPDAPADARTAGLLHWPSPDLGPAFAAALQPFARFGALALITDGQPRHPIEKALFAAGWQRHPAGMMHGEYSAWSAVRMPGLTYYVRGGDPALTALAAGGAEADGCIARYAMAATHVRPGDHVLIDGEVGADGAAILSALSRAGTVTRRTDAAEPADHSIDMIVAFEPAGADDWAERIDAYARLLKYDGRLVLGWRKRPGDNARPQDWPTLREALSQWLLPETRYLQRPASLDPSGPHLLQTAQIESALESPWLIVVAAANPLAGEGQAEAYDHPAYPNAAGPLPALVDFGAAYDNPFLYRAMVQMGERIGHDVTLARLAECVAQDARPDSADRGAALTVLGYRVLEMRQPELTPPLLRAIAAYMEPAGEDLPAHVARWRLSLAFLAGRLCELAGDRDAARGWYRRAADADWRRFSPLLTTKSIAASFYEARLCLAAGDVAAAHDCFRQGLDTALAAVAHGHHAQMGAADRPLPFYMQELAEVVDMGSQCANALAHLPLWERDPGLFWRQVDVRRFGLASWARDLERENARLRAA